MTRGSWLQATLGFAHLSEKPQKVEKGGTQCWVPTQGTACPALLGRRLSRVCLEESQAIFQRRAAVPGTGARRAAGQTEPPEMPFQKLCSSQSKKQQGPEHTPWWQHWGS